MHTNIFIFTKFIHLKIHNYFKQVFIDDTYFQNVKFQLKSLFYLHKYELKNEQ